MTATVLVEMQLKGNELLVQATCSTCWASGRRAVAYLAPKQPLPDPMYCPFCGTGRPLPNPSATSR